MKRNYLTPLWSVLVVMALAAGCRSRTAEITDPHLNQAFIVNSSPTFQGYFYLGSDSTHHHFESRWKYKRDRAFKIPVSDLAMAEPSAVGADERRIYVIKPSTNAPALFNAGGQSIHGEAPDGPQGR